MVTKRTLVLPVFLTGVSLLAGCGPPPREPRLETISMFADALVEESSNGSTTMDPQGWTGLQALGEPDTTGCGDNRLAWSPAVANVDGTPGIFNIDDWLVLEFPSYVYVREVRIYENYNPGAIVAVDLERSDDSSAVLNIYENQYGEPGAPCPSSFNIQIEENGGVTPDQWNRVAMYLDTDRIGDGNGNGNLDDDFPNIDAVEVIGDILIDD